MDFNETITFEGGINTDDTPQGMPKGDYRDFSYCRLGYNSGNAFAVETSDGTLVIPNPPGTITDADQILGATPWQKNNAIVYFVFKADLDHQIWVYYIDTQTHTLAVQGTELNFSRDWPVFHSNIVDDILKWTDGRWDAQMYEADGTRLFNPPYQINLAKALESPTPNGYYPVIDLQTIDAIKWPMDPPRVSYFTDPTRQDNKLRNKLFKFIIQPIYENGEVGVWSMYSNLDLPQQSELIPGTNWVYLNNSNGIQVQFFTGPKIIRKFNIAVQQFDKYLFGTEPPFGVFLQLDKEQDGLLDNTYHTVNFYGGTATSPASDVFKNYDRLPVVADCQEYLPTNELTYVNFREGYDKPSEPYEILNVGVDYRLNEIDWNAWAAIDFAISYASIGNSTITTDTDDFNALTLFPYSAGLVFFGPAPTSASIGQIVYQLTQQDIDTALASGPLVSDWNTAIMEIICDSFMDQLGYAPGSAAVLGTAIRYTFGIAPNVGGVTSPRIRTVKQTLATPSLKAGATHEFGIVYGDRAFRDSTVYTVDSMNLFVPWFYDIDRSGLSNPDSPFTINANLTINHIPPVWADRYWIVAKPATEILSFGQYTTNANSLIPGQQGYISSIKLDEVTRNRYVIAIDKYYVTQNKGAVIQHQIKIGDKIRFIRRRLDAPGSNNFDPGQVAYLPYLELDVVDYNPAGEGFDGRQVVYTNVFDTSLIETQAGLNSVLGHLFGQLIEIYTPRPSIDDTGNIFVSTWKDVTEAIEIRNAHTEDRAHGAPPKYYLNVGVPPGGVITSIYINGDFSFLQGSGQDLTIHYDDGTSSPFPVGVIVTGAKYNPALNVTIFTLPGVVPDSSMSYITFDNNYQTVSNLNSTSSASFNLDYGDVYVRQRNYQTGMDGGSDQAYYFIEDPNFSDYWSSDIHNTGRTRIEDQNAKMTHRQATAIHSGSFIFGTQVNGLSSFALNNENIKDMNPTFGPVVRAYMSGREGKTLKCLQPKKENSIYIQFYPNEVGTDSTVRVSNKTFASWFDYKSLLGCSNSGATAILPNGTTMYFDNNTGVFVYSGGNGQIQVSEIDPDTGKDYKFRTKTKQLAKAYNASTNPVVRTYVNESVGEVGFAFRFDVPYTGIAYGAFDGEVLPYFRIDGDAEYLYGYDIVLVFEESGNTYSGNINYVFYDSESGYTLIGIEGVTPNIDDFNQPGYYYTTSGLSYDHVVFDYVNMRWRSTYDYNFRQYCNLGQTLVGWGVDNQLYLHNQPNQWNFHGQPFTQKISFVSNDQPLRLKRYQDIALVSDKSFTITAQSEPNRSYPLGMKTRMPKEIINVYEGYGKVYYRKNLYDPRFFNENNICNSAYDPPTQPIDGWQLDYDQSIVLNQTITIIQVDGQIFTGLVLTAYYDPINDNTLVTLAGAAPGTNGVIGSWYYSDRAYLNGEDIRANALTHTLEYNPSIDDEGSVLFSVGINGVLS